MVMSELFIESHDLDWFAVNGEGFIAHFTTRGTDKLPSKLKESKPLWERQFDFLSNLPDTTGALLCEENLPVFNTPRESEEYLESFLSYARKGIFSYDIDLDDLAYKLIAFPKIPMALTNLPQGFGMDLVIIDHTYSCSSTISI